MVSPGPDYYYLNSDLNRNNSAPDMQLDLLPLLVIAQILFDVCLLAVVVDLVHSDHAFHIRFAEWAKYIYDYADAWSNLTVAIADRLSKDPKDELSIL